MVFQGNLGNGEIAMGSFAIAGSLLIILTYFLFPNLRKLRYIELVFYIAINDLIASIGLAIGPVPNDTFACWFQALSTDICYVSSAFWTVVILYQVYQVVIMRGTVLKNMRYIHLFCWGWPIILAILPLSTNTYNNPDDESTWCFIANTRYSPPWGELFWVIFSFFFWIWLTIFVNIAQIVQIMLKLNDMQVVSTAVISTVRKLIFYPLITALCWTLNTAANTYVFSTNSTFASMSSGWSTLASVGVLLALSQGLLNAFVFVGMNTIVREHWKELLYRIYMLLFCCKVVKERTIVRQHSHNGDIESPVHKGVFELEMSTHDSGRFDTPVRGSTAQLFRDSNYLQDQGVDRGVRLSAYFSVSLPVEDQSDYIGDYNDHAKYRAETQQPQPDRPRSGNTRPRRASNYNIRDSNFMRRSSLAELFRYSVAMLTGSGVVEEESAGGEGAVDGGDGGGDLDGGVSGVSSGGDVENGDATSNTNACATAYNATTHTTHTTDTIQEERASQMSGSDVNNSIVDDDRVSEYVYESNVVGSVVNPLYSAHSSVNRGVESSMVSNAVSGGGKEVLEVEQSGAQNSVDVVEGVPAVVGAVVVGGGDDAHDNANTTVLNGAAVDKSDDVHDVSEGHGEHVEGSVGVSREVESSGGIDEEVSVSMSQQSVAVADSVLVTDGVAVENEDDCVGDIGSDGTTNNCV